MLASLPTEEGGPHGGVTDALDLGKFRWAGPKNTNALWK